MANKSKYTFNQVESKLDIIKSDQGSNKVLYGDGTYKEPPQGTDGKDGVGISNIAKSATIGNIDVHTITLSDGSTYDFTVTNSPSDGLTEEKVNELIQSAVTSKLGGAY